jgi:hypothetical protein
MTDDFDRENRKNKKKENISKNKTRETYDFSEEQIFISKSKKSFKHKIEDMRNDELWEDWENMKQ